METVKVSSKGQILLPRTVREACAIRPGAEFVISVVEGEIHLKPAQPLMAPTTVAAGRGLLADPSGNRSATRKFASASPPGSKPRMLPQSQPNDRPRYQYSGSLPAQR